MQTRNTTASSLPPLPERLLCDEMLKGLGRWLRAAGYDTAIAEHGLSDEAILALAASEERLLLTCDRHLAQRSGAGPQAVVLESSGLDALAAELARRFAVDWLRAPFTRCLVDNVALRPAEESEQAAIPPKARALGGPITVCPRCGRVYWPGSHVRRMRARLAHWQDL